MSPPIQPYPFSPLVFIFPALSTVEFAALVASIREHGLLEPKAVWRGQIIDGRHRYLARVEPIYHFLDGDADPVAFVIDRNVNRRHLDTGAHAIAAYKLSRWSRPGGDRRSEEYRQGKDQSAEMHNGLDQRQASVLLRVSRRLTIQAGGVLSEDGPAAPVLREAVESRQVKIGDAYKLDFTHLKRHKRGNLQVDSTERPGVPEYLGQLQTVKTLPAPPAAGAAPEQWHPLLLLNQSQGGMCIYNTSVIGLGFSQKSFGL